MASIMQYTLAGTTGNVFSTDLVRDASLAGAVNGLGDKKDLALPPFVHIGGARTYVANPSASGGVLFFADGPVDANGQLIIDYLKNQGFLVLVLQYSFTSVAPPKDPRAGYVKWVDEQHKHIRQMVSQWLQGIQGDYGYLKYLFAVGCGFGASLALEACTPSNPGPNPGPEIIAGAVMHPDFIETSHILNIDKPVLFSFTNSNNPLDREVRPWVECILAGPKGNPNAKYSIQLFATNLGYGPGRNLELENEEYATLETARAMSEWFKRAAELKTGGQ